MQKLCIFAHFYFIFLFPVFCGGDTSFFVSVHSVFQEMAAGRSLFVLEKGRLVVIGATCGCEFYILTHLSFQSGT